LVDAVLGAVGVRVVGGGAPAGTPHVSTECSPEQLGGDDVFLEAAVLHQQLADLGLAEHAEFVRVELVEEAVHVQWTRGVEHRGPLPRLVPRQRDRAERLVLELLLERQD
jgi:hypothetical protein